MIIEWLPTAVRNRSEQIGYIAERNHRAAIAVGDAILEAADRLAIHPWIGRTGRVRGTRELPVGGTPYIIVYRAEDDKVLILRVLHGAQRWPP